MQRRGCLPSTSFHRLNYKDFVHYFDFETVARSARIPADKLDQLVKLFTLEEPHDPMLAELHILRACMAIQKGRLTLDEALNEARMLVA